MKLQTVLFFILSLSCAGRIESAETLQSVRLGDANYKVSFVGDRPFAKLGSRTFEGEKGKVAGDFASWIFKTGRKGNYDVGFELITNQKLKLSLAVNTNLESGGPDLMSASPDSKFVVFRFGSAVRDQRFEVHKADGTLVLKDGYFLDAKWTGKGLEYTLIRDVPTSDPREKKCPGSMAVQMKKYIFDGFEKKESKEPPVIECFGE